MIILHRFQWHRGTELITDIVTFDWFIIPVKVKTETNFSCRAVNSAGAGEPAIVYIEVLGYYFELIILKIFSVFIMFLNNFQLRLHS